MATVDDLPFPIPPRTSLRQPIRKRPQSTVTPLPLTEASLSTTNAKAKRASRRVTVQPGSPEVISSLISSLSAISAPAEDLFDNLPFVPLTASAPTSPGGNGQSTFAEATGTTGFGVDYGAFKAQRSSTTGASDAAIAPVIRTAKPPSGFSPLTAPKRSSIKSITPSMRSVVPSDTTRSIGNVSIEAGSNNMGGVAKAAARTPKPLDLKASKEKMRDLDRDRRRLAATGGVESGNNSPVTAVGRFGHSPAGTPPDSPLPAKGSRTASARAVGKMPMSKSSSLSELVIGPLGEDGGDEAFEPFGGGKVIPTRNSSLRQSLNTTSRRKRKSRSGMTVEEDSGKENTAPLHPSVEHAGDDAAATKAAEDVDEGDEVAKRIKQLKEQKALREQSQSETPPVEEQTEKRGKTRSRGHSSLPAPSLPQVTAPRSASATRAKSKEREGRPSDSKRSIPALPAGRSSLSQYRSHGTDSPAGRRKSQRASSEMDGLSMADSLNDAVQTYLSAPRLSQKIQHPTTGRAISFSDVGDPSGCVIFCCVGMGLTRYLTAFYDELALTLGLRLITPDRPGVGDSELDADGTPLSWPDDIRAICQHLGISRFSVLAHSAGAIYALATALRMPQHIRGRIHLLAPWIPPSQMVSIGAHQEPVPPTTLPYSQRILRSLPTTFLKAANSSFFSVTSTSITTSLPRSPRRSKRKSLTQETFASGNSGTCTSNRRGRRTSFIAPPKTGAASGATDALDQPRSTREGTSSPAGNRQSEIERQSEYDRRLTQGIWALATTNANPAVDLLVCLERTREIGFRYVDITKSVVIHHGTRDTRVPLDNVKWLGKTMRRCEVRILENEGHGLMAVAAVMGSVLTEMAQEWEDWNILIRNNGHKEPMGSPNEGEELRLGLKSGWIAKV